MNFVIVPIEVINYDKLSKSDVLLMGIITSLSLKNGYCFASNSYLSSKLKVSKRTISSSLTRLKEANLIEIKYERAVRRIYPKVWKNTSRGIEDNFTSTIETDFHHNIYSNNIKDKYITKIPIWIENPEMCKSEIATDEEQKELANRLSKYITERNEIS